MSVDRNDQERDIASRPLLSPAIEPFARLRDEMDAWFERYVRPSLTKGIAGEMLVAVDTIETDEAYAFHLDVPGVKQGDIDIEVEEGRLTVSGQRIQEESAEKSSFRRSERAFGAFTTSFRLPSDANAEKITAELKNGVLSVWVPKSEDKAKKAKKIAIKAG